MRISDWSSDVCSSDLWATISRDAAVLPVGRDNALDLVGGAPACVDRITLADGRALTWKPAGGDRPTVTVPAPPAAPDRSEEHTSELQSLMRISYAVFCLKKILACSRTTLIDVRMNIGSVYY